MSLFKVNLNYLSTHKINSSGQNNNFKTLEKNEVVKLIKIKDLELFENKSNSFEFIVNEFIPDACDEIKGFNIDEYKLQLSDDLGLIEIKLLHQEDILEICIRKSDFKNTLVPLED